MLVVDDERDIADLYTTWLGADHEVRTAYSGEEALEKVDEDVDIVELPVDEYIHKPVGTARRHPDSHS